LIVLDAHDDERWIHLETVQTVLRELGAHEVPRVLVMNKADLLEGEMISDLIRDEYGRIEKVYVSATTGEGIDRLRIIFNETFEHSVSPTKIAHSEIESL
ncbi:MAG: GTPase HflX, partial [Ferrovum sp.]|nr:GTPase HflX [Ferrovum sp.]